MTSFEIAAFLTRFNGRSSIFEVAMPTSTIHPLFKKNMWKHFSLDDKHGTLSSAVFWAILPIIVPRDYGALAVHMFCSVFLGNSILRCPSMRSSTNVYRETDRKTKQNTESYKHKPVCNQVKLQLVCFVFEAESALMVRGQTAKHKTKRKQTSKR